MTVYIPCYFNNIEERKQNFYLILNRYLELDYKIIIYWMNKESIEIFNNNLQIILGEKVNASVARNKLLSIFYKSNEDYGIFSDDDTYVNERIETIEDCISFTNDYYNKIIKTEKINSAFLILKNFKKYYNLEPFFDETLKANQDLDFGINLNILGINTYRKSGNEILIYKGKSSMFSNTLNKIYLKQKTLQYIETKYYGKYNIKNI